MVLLLFTGSSSDGQAMEQNSILEKSNEKSWYSIAPKFRVTTYLTSA